MRGKKRRGLVKSTLAAACLPGLASETAPGAMTTARTKIKLGVIGNGGRGLDRRALQKHGGYEMHAVADYFPDVVDKCGEALGVLKARRFSTFSGYRKH